MLITLIKDGKKERYYRDSEFEQQLERQDTIRQKACYYASKYDMTTKEAYNLAKSIVN